MSHGHPTSHFSFGWNVHMMVGAEAVIFYHEAETMSWDGGIIGLRRTWVPAEGRPAVWTVDTCQKSRSMVLESLFFGAFYHSQANFIVPKAVCVFGHVWGAPAVGGGRDSGPPAGFPGSLHPLLSPLSRAPITMRLQLRGGTSCSPRAGKQNPELGRKRQTMPQSRSKAPGFSTALTSGSLLKPKGWRRESRG